MSAQLATREHAVRFYGSDGELIPIAAASVREASVFGGIAVLAATPAHASAVEAAMSREGIDAGRERAAGHLVTLDAAQASAQLAADPTVERSAFERIVGEPVRRAVATRRPVRVFGEIVAVLWDAGDVMAALELEDHWNALRREIPFSLLCVYPACVQADPSEHVAAVLAAHSTVVDAAPRVSERGVARTFPLSTLSPRAARRFVTDELARDHRRDLVEDVAIVATELATNAVLHARSPFTLTMSWTSERVRVIIRDRSSDPPRLRNPSLEPSGRGLVLVSALADRWGSDPLQNGKTVWAEVSRGTPRPAGPVAR